MSFFFFFFKLISILLWDIMGSYKHVLILNNQQVFYEACLYISKGPCVTSSSKVVATRKQNCTETEFEAGRF